MCPTSNDGDQGLVQACLRGDQRAWALLIARYKRLIYSFPRRYGAGEADAADVFQLVCAELFVSLRRLRNCQSLRAWIMTVASHQAYHWKRRHVLRAQREGQDLDTALHAVSPTAGPSVRLEHAARAEAMRKAIAQLPPRCQTMLRLLFYQDPPVSYEQVAQQLGLATGSVGLTRARCLKKLERALAAAGEVPDAPVDAAVVRAQTSRPSTGSGRPCPCQTTRTWPGQSPDGAEEAPART